MPTELLVVFPALQKQTGVGLSWPADVNNEVPTQTTQGSLLKNIESKL